MSEGTANQSSEPEVWTVKRVLDWTIGHLRKHGCESARLDAEILLAHSRCCQRIQLYTQYDAPLTPEERSKMRDLVKRRAGHEPVAYLVGFREFFGLDFEVEPGVLIPRPDTETLVVRALELAREIAAPRILDLCTGSGCVAAAIAENCRNAVVTAVELDDQAFAIASRNLAKHELADRVTLLQGDLFEPLPDGELFDLIVSNPPYVTTAELDTLPPDVRLHEPHRALDGGVDGLDIVRRIIAEGHSRLKSGGALLLEIGSEQAATVEELFAQAGAFEPAIVEKDLAGHCRVVWARKR
ncbi:peptide chain release factor N(5)-glutamine methyltransferase [bacterium]|nr:peptide chain release factor N(5)-glutamine methyltransferase [bacterium]